MSDHPTEARSRSRRQSHGDTAMTYRCGTCRWATPDDAGTIGRFICASRLPPMLRRAGEMQNRHVEGNDWCVLHAEKTEVTVVETQLQDATETARTRWNAEADQYNQWPALGDDERSDLINAVLEKTDGRP